MQHWRTISLFSASPSSSFDFSNSLNTFCTFLWSCIRSSMASISAGFCSCDLWLRLVMRVSPSVKRQAGIASLGSRRRLGVHDLGLIDRRAVDLLVQRWTAPALDARRPDGPSGPGRFVQRADHAHVREALLARGLRIAAAQHAVREIRELGRELVALLEHALLDLLADGQVMAQRAGVLEPGLEA